MPNIYDALPSSLQAAINDLMLSSYWWGRVFNFHQTASQRERDIAYYTREELCRIIVQAVEDARHTEEVRVRTELGQAAQPTPPTAAPAAEPVPAASPVPTPASSDRPKLQLVDPQGFPPTPAEEILAKNGQTQSQINEFFMKIAEGVDMGFDFKSAILPFDLTIDNFLASRLLNEFRKKKV